MTAGTYSSGWAMVADQLGWLGIDTIFGLPGDDLALLPALSAAPTRLVMCRDQRNATFMATGYAIAAGRPGACVVGKGPAVTNTLTGLLEARTARVPLLVYAGGTAAERLGSGAFQELDQVAVSRPVTKWATRVERSEQLGPILDKAALVATAGTPGPVYVELPEPVGAAPTTRTQPWRPVTGHWPVPAEPVLATSYRLLRGARRPLLLVGGGARHRNPDRRIERLAESLGAGLATTASGRGSVDERHPLFCGLSGLYAVAPLAQLWQETDLVVALGSRLEETATHGWPAIPVPVVQVTVSEEDVTTGPPGEVVLADVGHTVDAWLARAAVEAPTPDPGWVRRIAAARASAITAAQAGRGRAGRRAVPVVEVLTALDRIVPPERIMVHENGLQDMWSYFFPYWSCRQAGGTVVPSEQTSLGFGAAAAAGVAGAAPDRPVVAFVGDGAFQLFAPDLSTLAGAGLAVLYVVLRNGGYGWLHANAQRVPGLGDRFRFLVPGRRGAAALAEDCGLAYAEVADRSALAPALERAWRACAGGRAAVVDVHVDVRDVPPGLGLLSGDFPHGRPDDPAPLATGHTGGTT